MKKDKAAVFIEMFLNLFHIKLREKTKDLIIQIFKFGIVGGIAFIIDFVFLFLFKEKLHLPVILANTLSFTISTIYNYIASVTWVFDVKKENDKKKQFITFIVFSIIGLLLNDLIMLILTGIFIIYYLASKIIATIIVMIFNFITRKKFLE